MCIDDDKVPPAGQKPGRPTLPDAWPSRSRLAHASKQLALRTPLRELFTYRYRFMFSPSQLCLLCQQITNTADVPGSIIEVGCAFGATTVFLNRHIDTLGIDVDYYAVDTFTGFTAKDISCEHARGRHYRYDTEFRGNSKPWFDRTMRRNGVKRVTSFRADAATFDYTPIAPFRFALVDVDLYHPVLAVLEKIYGLVSPGGVIVTDDCRDGGRWAGAYEAFGEFTKANSIDATITEDDLGLITRPRLPWSCRALCNYVRGYPVLAGVRGRRLGWLAGEPPLDRGPVGDRPGMV